MYKILFFTAILIFSGCSSSDSNKETKKEVEVSKSNIKVSAGEKTEYKKAVSHEKELKKDDKDFYYSLKDKKEKSGNVDETFTRVDAQRNVKNKVVDGKATIVYKNHTKENPYKYVRIDLLKRALSNNFMVKCSACHDNYANGIIGPSLLQKDEKYIYETLVKYLKKPEANVLMKDLVKNMGDDELKEIAKEIALFNKEVRELKGME